MDFCLPDLGEGIVQAELVQWMVAPGDQVNRGQNLAEVMTDKAAVELPSPFEGTIDRLLVQPGAFIDVGSVMATFESADAIMPPPAVRRPATAAIESQQPLVAAPSDASISQPPATVGVTDRPVAAPSVRRMARQLGIDLSKIQGSGPKNRILVGDLQQPVQAPATESAPSPQRPATTDATASVLKPGDVSPAPGTRVPLKGLRRTIAERMSHATRTIPHFSYVDEADLTDLVKVRVSLQAKFADEGIKLTYLPFIIKAAIGALKAVPQVNASIDSDANEIVLHDRYHIGIATDTPNGLLVPVLRDVDQKDLKQIARELTDLTRAARAGKSKRTDLSGSTFTITSTGGIGGLISTPIINEPGVGILGVGQIVKRPRFDAAGQILAADVAYLSYSFDHRVVDGADAARFSNMLIQGLQQPATLLLPTP